MELMKLSRRTKLVLVLGIGYPLLAFISVISLSFCIDKMDTKVCMGLIPNIQSIWTLWIFCTILLVILILIGKKKKK